MQGSLGLGEVSIGSGNLKSSVSEPLSKLNTGWERFFRNSISAELIAIRVSHEEKAHRPSNLPIWTYAFNKVSCNMSSASATSRVILRIVRRICFECRRHNSAYA